jgi:hypothetical protein
MDLQLWGRVLWRFRILVAVGLAVASVLALLSFTKVSFDNGVPRLTYREPEDWVSYSTLFVTERGFPWGKLSTGGASGVDPARLTSLAVIYTQLALSDDVRKIVLRDGPIEGRIEAATVTAAKDDALPLVRIAALAPSAEKAQILAARETAALRAYISGQQRANTISAGNRVLLQVVSRPSAGTLYTARGKTRPIVVFLAVLIAFCALAFVLENVRPASATARSDPGEAATPPQRAPSAVEPHSIAAARRDAPDAERSPSRDTLHVPTESPHGEVAAAGRRPGSNR